MQEIKTNPTVRHTTPLQLLAAFAATVAVLFVLLLGACALPAQPVDLSPVRKGSTRGVPSLGGAASSVFTSSTPSGANVLSS